jgi:hypothetical protein
MRFFGREDASGNRARLAPSRRFEDAGRNGDLLLVWWADEPGIARRLAETAKPQATIRSFRRERLSGVGVAANRRLCC